MGWSINDINPELRQRIEAQHVDRPARGHAEGKPHHQHPAKAVKVRAKAGCHALQQAEGGVEGHRFLGPVRVRFTHYRKKLCDGDGYFIKHALDAIVDAGILPDDGPEVIPQPPVQEHYKVETFEEERTEILIEEL